MRLAVLSILMPDIADFITQAERALRACKHGMNPFKDITKAGRVALQKLDPEGSEFKSNPRVGRIAQQTTPRLRRDCPTAIGRTSTALSGAGGDDEHDDDLGGDEDGEGDDMGSRSALFL